MEIAWIVNNQYFEILISLDIDRGWGAWNNDLLCPTTEAIGSPNWNIIGSNYGINYWMFKDNLGLPDWGEKNTSWAIPVAKIINPSNSVAFTDCTDWILKTVEGYTEEDELENTGKGPLAFRHDGVAHAVNFDASVSSYTADDVKEEEILKRFTLAR